MTANPQTLPAERQQVPAPQQRRNQRMDVCVPVSLCTKNYHAREAAHTGNVSQLGLFVYTENYSLDKDEKICLEIEVVAGRKIRLLGTVVWSNFFPVQSAPAEGRGIGIRLHSDAADGNSEFQSWLESLGLRSSN